MSTVPPPTSGPASLGAQLSVRLAIALAFADASVAVLALPQIVIRLHTSISAVTWVITAYNIALIVTTLAILPFAARLASRRALVTGLALFGLASLGSGAAGSLPVLIVWRCLQGAGGGVLLSASLPMFAARGSRDDGQLRAWAAAAALGAAVGPAAGGILTQLFDWRAIFFAQAPVAAAAALAALTGHLSPAPAVTVDAADPAASEGAAAAPVANLALGLLSAGLIGVLFLATVLLINVWLLTPLGAAGLLAVIPLATLVTERAAGELRVAVAGRAGAIVLALGLVMLALVSHRVLGVAILALALCGVGLGLAFPSLTRAALRTRGLPVARAARTVATREGGLVVGLVLLTPILVGQLNAAPARATTPILRALLGAPLSLSAKFQLGVGLEGAAGHAPESQLPDIGPPFARAEAGASPTARAALVRLQGQVAQIIQRAVTRGFRTPLLVCAALCLLALPTLGLGRIRARTSRGP